MKTFLNTATESKLVKEITLPLGQSAQAALEAWTKDLTCYCLFHQDEVLDRARCHVEDRGRKIDQQKLSEWIRTVRATGQIFDNPLFKDDGTLSYRLHAHFHPCGLCLIEEAGVPPLFHNCTFRNFKTDNVELEFNLAKCREFAAAPHGFLVMIGGVGTGKSQLAAATLRECHRWGGHYFRHSDLVTRLRANYLKGYKSQEREEDIRSSCCDAKLLVIDEIGTAVGGNDAEVLLYDVLDYRYTHLLPTVLCSNLNANDFKTSIGERLTDRFREAIFEILRFNSPSRRKTCNSSYLARAKARPF
jgi:DNA replication protein DnaC